MAQILDKNCKPFWGESEKNTPPTPPPSKNEELKEDISWIAKSNFGCQLVLGASSVTVSYLIHYDILLQNGTGTLLENATEVYYKMLRLLQITLFNLITGGGVGTIPILGKNCKGAIPTLRKICNPPALLQFINTSSPVPHSQIIIFIYFTYPILLLSCPPNPLLINHVFSWKTKLKHTGVDITCFFYFSRCKIFTNKT